MTEHINNNTNTTNNSSENNGLAHQLKRNFLRVALTSFFLGACTTVGLGLIAHAWFYSSSAAEYALGIYIITVHVVFHMSEFLIAASLRPHDTSPDAFMLFHSREYLLACAMAFVEFTIEVFFIPESFKLFSQSQDHYLWASLFRLSFMGSTLFSILTLIFYGVRVLAMLQCTSNFSLMIEVKRRNDHVLVDHGLYAVLRHPAYFGWFWRTVFAQCILANPISAVVHTAVTWLFFSRRIPFEEAQLEREDYFGEYYKKYKSRTHIGIPFISSR